MWNVEAQHRRSTLLDILHHGTVVLRCNTILISLLTVPQSQVVADELHDQSAVLVGILLKHTQWAKSVPNGCLHALQAAYAQTIQFSNGAIKGVLRQCAGLCRVALDLIVEHREVQAKAEADWVGGPQAALCL